QPSVILLSRYVRPPNSRRVSLSRRGVLRRDNHRCAYCGKAASTSDHVVPRSRGGPTSRESLVACCRGGKNRKGNRTQPELCWKLDFRPQEPRLGQLWMRGIDKPVEKWRPFLEYSYAA